MRFATKMVDLKKMKHEAVDVCGLFVISLQIFFGTFLETKTFTWVKFGLVVYFSL